MRKSLALGLVVALGFATGHVFSNDDPGRPSDDMIKAMERYGTPGPEHALLKKLEGSFDVRAKATFDPSQPAKESTGRSEAKIVLGGLFLKEDFHGTCPFTGKSFEGVGYTGFDNVKKKYVNTWTDSLGSGIHLSEGTADAGGKVITFNGKCADALTGAEKNVRTVLTIVDDRQHRIEIFGAGPDGKEHRNLELTYTKK